MDAFTGEIRPYAFSFAPSGWMPCAGQLLAISQYSTLFSIIGTQYGGNGTTTFALPDLRSAVANGSGTLPGGSTYTIGETAGTSNVTLLSTEMPAHTHTVNGGVATSGLSAVTVPTNSTYISNSISIPAPGSTTSLAGHSYVASSLSPSLTSLNPATVGISGGSQAHNNMAPYLAISYCICVTTGQFPARN